MARPDKVVIRPIVEVTFIGGKKRYFAGAEFLPKSDTIVCAYNDTNNVKYELRSKNGDLILPPNYREIKEEGDYIFVDMGKKKCGFGKVVDGTKWEEIIKSQYHNVTLMQVTGIDKVFFLVQNKYHCGLFDEEGNCVIPIKYELIGRTNKPKTVKVKIPAGWKKEHAVWEEITLD